MQIEYHMESLIKYAMAANTTQQQQQREEEKEHQFLRFS